jgi:hypothetical protein
VSDISESTNLHADPTEGFVGANKRVEVNISSPLSDLKLGQDNKNEFLIDAITNDFENDDTSIGSEQLYKLTVNVIPSKVANQEGTYKFKVKYHVEGDGVSEQNFSIESQAQLPQKPQEEAILKEVLKETPRQQEEEDFVEEMISSTEQKKEDLSKNGSFDRDEEDYEQVKPKHHEVDEMDFEEVKSKGDEHETAKPTETPKKQPEAQPQPQSQSQKKHPFEAFMEGIFGAPIGGCCAQKQQQPAEKKQTSQPQNVFDFMDNYMEEMAIKESVHQQKIDQ